MHKDIKTSYFGGITELHRPANKEGQVLYHYDVNFFCPYQIVFYKIILIKS